jgi:hypothetical protein
MPDQMTRAAPDCWLALECGRTNASPRMSLRFMSILVRFSAGRVPFFRPFLAPLKGKQPISDEGIVGHVVSGGHILSYGCVRNGDHSTPSIRSLRREHHRADRRLRLRGYVEAHTVILSFRTILCMTRGDGAVMGRSWRARGRWHHRGGRAHTPSRASAAREARLYAGAL